MENLKPQQSSNFNPNHDVSLLWTGGLGCIIVLYQMLIQSSKTDIYLYENAADYPFKQITGRGDKRTSSW